VTASPPGDVRQRGPVAHLDGILVMSKPAGPTSHDVVALLRRLTGVKRVGHGGTLDPFAQGVLPVFMGRATRMVEYHLADAKRYRATVVLGASSSTDDLDGELRPGEAPAPDRERLVAVLAGFGGPIEQVPPDHSAVHVAGRRAYEVARDGGKPELAPRRVTIHALELLEWDAALPERPLAVLDVHCSAGTYVRSLARDLGVRLGCGAYLGALTRTASGPFRLEDARDLDEIRGAAAEGRLAGLMLPPDAGLEAIPSVELPAGDLAALVRGQVVRVSRVTSQALAAAGPGESPALPRAHLVRVRDAHGRLAAMAHLVSGRLHPDKVLVAPES
jgi:tRNA pseudouridine55 synthase